MKCSKSQETPKHRVVKIENCTVTGQDSQQITKGFNS